VSLLRVLLALACLVLQVGPLWAQGVPPSQDRRDPQAADPFRFREAYFLERRLFRSGSQFSGNPATYLRRGYSPTMQMIPDSSDPKSYRFTWKLEVMLREIDHIAAAGGWREADRLYRQFLGSVRRAQGESASDVSFTLGHMGEFLLATHEFDEARQAFTDAIRIRRATLDPALPDMRTILRLHLATLLTHLGEIELAHGDLDAAGTHLAEAVGLDNDPDLAIFADSLDAAYFQSLVFERQHRWTEAEKLWQKTVTSRETIGNQPYRDACSEMAAFYARRGDFQGAAQIVVRTSNALRGKQYQSAQPLPFWTDSETADSTPLLYERLRYSALRLILAVDEWTRNGNPDTAARYFSFPFDVEVLDRGAAADRLRLLEWLESCLFMPLSVLLDGNPPEERVKQAYTLLSGVKGRFLTSAALDLQNAQQGPDPGNPDRQGMILANLANAHEALGHVFWQAALSGQPLDEALFSTNETTERTLMEALSAPLHRVEETREPVTVPEGTEFIDIVRWNRVDRLHLDRAVGEYGAFVSRKNQPLRYVRLGSAVDIDSDVKALETSMEVFSRSRMDNSAQVRKILSALYESVLAPLEKELEHTTRVLIVPDGDLTLVPIDAFIDSRGHYFLESHTLSYLTSLRDLRAVDRLSTARPSTALIVADPNFDLSLSGDSTGPSRERFSRLKGAAAEADTITALLKPLPIRTLQRDDAREQVIKSVINPAFIHFATHSDPYLIVSWPQSHFAFFEYPSSDNPFLHSAIALAGANRAQSTPEDGVLTALEISTMRLAGTALVVLSSCQSGAGHAVKGQGIMGLRTAFFMAGARSLVMNLWTEDDNAGRLLMQDFYTRISASARSEGTNAPPPEADIADALRLARLRMSSDPQFNHPYFWSGYGYAGLFRSWKAVTPGPAPLPASSQENNSESTAAFTPRCFEIAGRNYAIAGNLHYRVRVKINSAHAVRNTNGVAVYDIHLPGNEVEFDSDGAPPLRSSQREIATLTVQKQSASSGIKIEVGNFPVFAVELGGPPDLFATLDVPEKLPELAKYTKASVSSSSVSTETVDYLGSCRVSP
jgi:CHAT domain-containing protein